MHGIVWGIGTDQLIKEKWSYGITYTGNYVNEKTINYITKYITKIDEKHPDFVGKVLCSKGIGAGYTKRPDAAKHKYKKGETKHHYRARIQSGDEGTTSPQTPLNEGPVEMEHRGNMADSIDQ